MSLTEKYRSKIHKIRSFLVRNIFGQTFWSTVLRPTIGLAIYVLACALVGLLLDLETEGFIAWAVYASTLLMAIFMAFTTSWGVAFRRFEERPVPDSSFRRVAAGAGVLIGPAMLLFMYSAPTDEALQFSDYVFVGVFFSIMGALVGVVVAHLARRLRLIAPKRNLDDIFGR